MKLQLTESDGFAQRLTADFPASYRRFISNRYLAVTDLYEPWGDIFFKTRYQTVRITTNEQRMIESIVESGGVVDEGDFVAAYEPWVDEHELRVFISRLEQADAIDVLV